MDQNSIDNLYIGVFQEFDSGDMVSVASKTLSGSEDQKLIDGLDRYVLQSGTHKGKPCL
jgi:hypothetical protein